jgi:hypothetical protein
MEIESIEELNALMNPPTHEWRLVRLLKAGDLVRWWCDDSRVVGVVVGDNNVLLEVIDPLTNLATTVEYKHTDEVLVARCEKAENGTSSG